MRLLTDLTPMEPALGLAIEEVLLDSVRANRVETIRLWRNTKAIILGRSQSLATEVEQDNAAELGIPILRRISGGGTVYHYPGNLNISVFLQRRSDLSDVATVFRFFGEILSRALTWISSDLHAHDNGLYIGSKKIGGAAQAHRGRALLYHTTLLVQESPVCMETILSAMRPGYCAGGIASRPRQTTTLSEQRATPLEPQELVTPIVEALACTLGVVPCALGVLTPQENQRAIELQTTKYGSSEWNARL